MRIIIEDIRIPMGRANLFMDNFGFSALKNKFAMSTIAPKREILIIINLLKYLVKLK